MQPGNFRVLVNHIAKRHRRNRDHYRAISSSAVSVSTTVSEVLTDLSKVWFTLKLTTLSNASPGNFPTFSRMRSNTTMVSWTEKPTTVRSAVTNSASTSNPATLPRMAHRPTTSTVSCNRAITAHAPYRQGLGTCRNAYDR